MNIEASSMRVCCKRISVRHSQRIPICAMPGSCRRPTTWTCRPLRRWRGCWSRSRGCCAWCPTTGRSWRPPPTGCWCWRGTGSCACLTAPTPRCARSATHTLLVCQGSSLCLPESVWHLDLVLKRSREGTSGLPEAVFMAHIATEGRQISSYQCL